MSILTSSRRNSSSSTSDGKCKAVRFELNYNLKSLLDDFVSEKDRKVFEDLLCQIKTAGEEIRDDELSQLLKEARGCISVLNGNFTLFVQVVLFLKWTHRSDEVVNEYKGFLLNLCSAHNYFTKVVVDHLVGSFIPETADEWPDGEPPGDYLNCIQHIHSVILSVLNLIPMSENILLSCLSAKYPYFRKPAHHQEAYVYNILRIITYEPSLREEILKLLINKLILLDVHTPRDELKKAMDEQMETDDAIFSLEDTQTTQSVGNPLDICLKLLYKFLYQQCHDRSDTLVWDKTKSLYTDLLKIFDCLILPTHAVHHVQFVLFYVLSFKPQMGVSFVQYLWKKVINPNIAPVIRQTATSYIASFLCRAQYVQTTTLLDTLVEMAKWVNSYIDCQDNSGSSAVLKAHSVFYAACQSIFYVIAFRYKELVSSKKGLMILQSLNLPKVVSCRLNPLKFCQPAVVSSFASIARGYQIAYCYSIIERNSRRTLPQVQRDVTGAITTISNAQLETFFPFDPYLLEKSSSFIAPLYREYSNLDESEAQEESDGETEREDIDDFLESPPHKEGFDSQLATFSYSTSPGFLHF